jgi:hypothetical protein
VKLRQLKWHNLAPCQPLPHLGEVIANRQISGARKDNRLQCSALRLSEMATGSGSDREPLRALVVSETFVIT